MGGWDREGLGVGMVGWGGIGGRGGGYSKNNKKTTNA